MTMWTPPRVRVNRHSQFAAISWPRVLAEELPLVEARQRIIDAFEARYIQNIIEQHSGNMTRAAAAAGIDRRHFYRLRAKAKV